MVLFTRTGAGYRARMTVRLVTPPGLTSEAPAAAAEVARAFAEAWAAPQVERFAALLAPDVVLLQPVTPRIVGRDAARAEFARLLRWLPDLRGTVDHWAADGQTLLIAWRLAFTVGRKRLELPIVDRIVVRDALIGERAAYFDPLPLLLAVLARPGAWPGYLRYRGFLG